MKLFLDTNVLIDFILERPAFYLPTAMIVSFAVEGKIELAVSSMSVDSADIYQSYDTKWKDFEDGVQYASAKRWGANYIVTRNVKDFEETNGDVITPDEACVKLQNIEKI